MSEQGPESLDGFLLSPSPVDLSIPCERFGNRRNPYKILDTFRDRLEKYPDPDPASSICGHSKTYSDSVLFNVNKNPTATIVNHNGTSFEILNPHESLRFARIVSYIEDVDTYSSRDSSRNHRDSYRSDDAIPEFETSSIDRGDPCGEKVEVEAQKVHHDLVGDCPHLPMPSISERLEKTNAGSIYTSDCHRSPIPRSSSRLWTAQSYGSGELGEPGSPIYDDDLPSSHNLWPKTTDYSQFLQTGYPETEIQCQRRSTRRSTSNRRKRTNKGPFRRLCGFATALRKRRLFRGEAMAH
ncbi:hypothetical protein EYZ11_009383 [Aspergillus tanneri]|nr:hypothetical protein EYZ11_009383 [Aspergillus tanneri]